MSPEVDAVDAESTDVADATEIGEKAAESAVETPAAESAETE